MLIFIQHLALLIVIVRVLLHSAMKVIVSFVRSVTSAVMVLMAHAEPAEKDSQRWNRDLVDKVNINYFSQAS